MTAEKLHPIEQRHERERLMSAVVDTLSLTKEVDDQEASFLLLVDVVRQKVEELLALPEVSGTELFELLIAKSNDLNKLIRAEQIDYGSLVKDVDKILAVSAPKDGFAEAAAVSSHEPQLPFVRGEVVRPNVSQLDVPAAKEVLPQPIMVGLAESVPLPTIEKRSYDTVSILFPDRKIKIGETEYAVEERIGSGATKHVYRAESESGEMCAVACITLPVFSGSTRREREMILQSITSEVRISHELSDVSAVLQYHGVRYFDRAGKEISAVGELTQEEMKLVHYAVLTSDLVSGNNLYDTAKKEKATILGSYKTLVDLSVAEVQRGVEILHQNPAFLLRVQREVDEMRQRGSSEPEETLREQVIKGLLTDQVFEAKKREREIRNFDKLKQVAQQVLTASYTAAQGLDAMHGRGFVHNDIKPDNVFPASIIDLGSAAQEGTLVEGFHGTPHYMDPGLVNNRDIAAEKVFHHRAQDKRAFAQSLIEIACTILDLPEFVSQPPERLKNGDVLRGSAFLQSFRSFEDIKDGYAFLADVYLSGFRFPDVLTDALSVQDAQSTKAKRSMLCTELVSAVSAWVSALSYEQAQSMRKKIEKLTVPETYTEKNPEYVAWVQYKKDVSAA